MANAEKAEHPLDSQIVPIGERVLLLKDENKRETKSGIVLPGNVEIPTLTGRIVAVSEMVANNEDYPIKQYDKVLFDPRGAIPVEFEQENKLFIIHIENVIAIIQRKK